MRFNKPVQKKQTELSPEFKLYLLACSDSLFSQSRTNSKINELRSLVKEVAPEYVARLAAYSRRCLNNRAAGQLLTAALVREVGGEWSRAAVFNVIQRADEFGELVAAVNSISEQRKKASLGVLKKDKVALPSSLKRGLADVFESERFDEFQYSKWNKRNVEFKLRDVLRLCHPKPKTEKQVELFKKIDRDELVQAGTHESKIGKIRSEIKNTEERKVLETQTWLELLREKKLSHTALIREAKHILSTDVQLLELYISEFIRTSRKSQIFPHQYIQMLREVLNEKLLNPVQITAFMTAIQSVMIERAREISKAFGKRLVVVIDTSGSMFTNTSDKSKNTRIDVAACFGCSLVAAGHRGIVFSAEAAVIPPITQDLFNGINMSAQLVGNRNTNFNKAVKLIGEIPSDQFDAVLVLTDMDFNVDLENTTSSINQVLKNKPIYYVDLSGQLEHPIDLQGNSYFLAGLNFSSLSILQNLQKGGSVIDEIKKFELLKP